MKIIALEKECPGKTVTDLEPHLKNEALKVHALMQKDIIREIYFRRDQSSAVLMLECDSLKMAQNVLNQLPLVKNNLIEFELIPLKPYPGFGRLLEG